jgi:hypothetical protein
MPLIAAIALVLLPPKIYQQATPQSIKLLQKYLSFRPVIWDQIPPMYRLDSFEVCSESVDSTKFQAVSLHYITPQASKKPGRIGIRGPDFYVVEARTRRQVQIVSMKRWLDIPDTEYLSLFWRTPSKPTSVMMRTVHGLGIGLFYDDADLGMAALIRSYIDDNLH